jgi:hypothetical protein
MIEWMFSGGVARSIFVGFSIVAALTGALLGITELVTYIYSTLGFRGVLMTVWYLVCGSMVSYVVYTISKGPR